MSIAHQRSIQLCFDLLCTEGALAHTFMQLAKTELPSDRAHAGRLVEKAGEAIRTIRYFLSKPSGLSEEQASILTARADALTAALEKVAAQL